MKVIIICFLFVFSNITVGEDVVRDYFYVSIDAKGVYASVKINGFEAIEHNEGFSLISSSPIDFWLSGETNSIAIDVKSQLDNKMISGDLSVEVFKHDPKYDTPTPGVSYLKFNLSDETDVVGKLASFKKSSDFLIKHSLGTELWKDAELIGEVSVSDKQEILSLVKSIEAAILAKDTNLIVSLFEYKISEDARVNNKALSEAKALAEREFSSMFSSGSFQVSRKFDAELMSLEKISDSKVLVVSGLEGESALQFVIDDEYDLSIDVYVSKIDGKWKVVR